MKTPQFILLLFISISFFSCEKITNTTRKITSVKYLQPGVNNVFAAKSISDQSFALYGIDSESRYDFGKLSSLIFTVQDQDIDTREIEVPDNYIAFPSNIIILEDNSSVFFAMQNNGQLAAYWFDAQGEFDKKQEFPGYSYMVVLAAQKNEDGFWLLLNNVMADDYSTKSTLIKTNSELSDIQTIYEINYNAQAFAGIIGVSVFNNYNLFANLQDYCMLKEYNGNIYVNGPMMLDNDGTTTIGLVQIIEADGGYITAPVVGFADSFVKEIDLQTSNGTLYTVVYDLSTKQVSFYSFLEATYDYQLIATKTDIAPSKRILFAHDETSTEHDKLIVATKYNNNTYIYSPGNTEVNFSMGSNYETEVKAAFWGGTSDDELILIGNTMLYNQFAANFIYILPKESLYTQ